MWINFKSDKKYAIKVYVGAVNAVSGEPCVETAATTLRRRQRLARQASIQDYVVVPDQKWLDGIATATGQVRQFVAMPMGSGHSVEAQVTGQEAAGGLQFEITPLVDTNVYVRTLIGKTIEIPISLSETVLRLKELVRATEKVPVDRQRLIYSGRQLDGMACPGSCREAEANLRQII